MLLAELSSILKNEQSETRGTRLYCKCVLEREKKKKEERERGEWKEG